MTNLLVSTNNDKSSKSFNSISRIIEAAIHCIAKYGYENASMNEISKTAGVSKSLLHYHFKSKEDLLFKAVNHMTVSVASEIGRQIQGREHSIQLLYEAGDALFELLISRQERVSFLTEMYATAIYNKRLLDRLKEYNKVQTDLIHNILKLSLGDASDRLMALNVDVVKIIQTAIQGVTIDSLFIKDRNELKKHFVNIKNFIINSILMLIE